MKPNGIPYHMLTDQQKIGCFEHDIRWLKQYAKQLELVVQCQDELIRAYTSGDVGRGAGASLIDRLVTARAKSKAALSELLSSAMQQEGV